MILRDGDKITKNGEYVNYFQHSQTACYYCIVNATDASSEKITDDTDDKKTIAYYKTLAREKNKLSKQSSYINGSGLQTKKGLLFLDDQGGDGGDGYINAIYGKLLPKVSEPIKSGYSFDGYYKEVNGEGTRYVDEEGNPDAEWDQEMNSTIYANWIANSYTITLNRQDGVGSTDTIYATYDSEMPNITIPAKSGYIFQGYYTEINGDGKKYINADGTSAQNWDKPSNATLYARWERNTYTVTLDKQEGAGGTDSVTVLIGEAMPNIEKPTKSGYYRFTGYFDAEGIKYYNSDGTSVRDWDKNMDTTLYAHWTKTMEYGGTDGYKRKISTIEL